MSSRVFDQQVTFIYTRDLNAGSSFLGEKLGLRQVLNQNDHCLIYAVTNSTFLGVCANREPPDDPGVTYSFVTDDVDFQYQEWLDRGVKFNAPPAYSERFKVYSTFFGGIENYRFELQQFRDPAWIATTSQTRSTET
jgi:hypothetical protein